MKRAEELRKICESVEVVKNYWDQEIEIMVDKLEEHAIEGFEEVTFKLHLTLNEKKYLTEEFGKLGYGFYYDGDGKYALCL